MALPVAVRQDAETKVKQFCQRRVPAHFHDRIRLEYETSGSAITIVERRPTAWDVNGILKQAGLKDQEER